MNPTPDSRGAAGFTRNEVLVIGFCLTVIAELLLPSLTQARSVNNAIQCLNNHRQLIVAWQQYAADHDGRLMLVEATAPWVSGHLDWTTSTDNTNSALLADPTYGRLARYLSGEASVYKCPPDIFLSNAQKTRGLITRVRSVSANNVYSFTTPFETDSVYRYTTNVSQFLYPGPSEAFVFLDEHPDSLNDGAFFSPRLSAWIDFPSVLHEGGATFSFADGHAEIHEWKDLQLNLSKVKYQKIPSVPVRTKDPDVNWVAYHTPRRSTRIE